MMSVTKKAAAVVRGRQDGATSPINISTTKNNNLLPDVVCFSSSTK